MSRQTKTLHFEGHSDDTFGEYKTFNDDYDNCATGKPIVFRVDASGESLFVFGQYAPTEIEAGTWVIGIAPADENCDLPTWPMRYESTRHQYSPRLVIETPDDVTITCLNAKKAKR